MAESHKGTSPAAGSQKKSSSLDEDFGNDFLTSWKSAKVGKDSIDFDVETVPCIGKKSFNFDKLDDFELGGAFDKISTFKVDMSDLDFSRPHKKVDRHKEKSAKESGKQESKQDKFSFTFDFHELDRFSLDSDLLKGKKVTSKSMEDVGADCSVEHDRNQDFGGNSVTSTDAFERDKAKREPNADGLAASRPRNLTDPSTVNGSVPLSSNLANHDMSYEARTSAERQINTVDEKQVDIHNNEWPRGHSNGACSKKPFAEKAVQENILQSVSGHGSADEASSKLQAGLTSGPLNADSAKKQDTSLRSLESSQSRNSSPVNSYNSRCGPETTKLESLNISDGFQKCQGKQVEAIGGSALSATTEHQIDGGNASDTAISQKNLDELKNYGEKQTPSSVILQPSPYRDSGIVKSVAVKEKTPTARQFKSLERSAGSSSQSTSSLIPKQMIPIHHRKIETIHFYPANEKIEPKKNDWQPENQNGSILKSVDRSMIKGRSIIRGKEKNDKDIDASCQSIASSATKSSSLAFISRTPPTKSSSIISVERQDVSLKDDKKSDIPVLTSSRLMKLNISTTKSTIPRETKSVKFLKEKLVLPQSMISKVANPVTTEKHAFLSPSLKRKTLEEPKEDPVHQNPLKHGTDSATKRRTSLEASPKFYEKVIPSPEACHNNTCADQITSPIGALVVGSMMNFEIPVLVENDGNAEKAEACAKELDDICNMLKKKHEEAKELLVRVIVNDNSLLMLNHPMFEEKIHALQRFADSLQSKEFW